jgi:hypothetical protein
MIVVDLWFWYDLDRENLSGTPCHQFGEIPAAGGQVFFTVLGNNNHKCYDNAPDNGHRIAIVAPLCS